MSELGINFVTGNAALLNAGVSGSIKIIAHICNDVGVWSSDGFTGALDRIWPFPKRDYIALWRTHRKAGRIPRGHNILTKIRPPDIYVYSMIVQAGAGTGLDRVDYVQLETCLTHLNDNVIPALTKISKRNAEVHMPRIGTGYAGGSWDIIETIIQQTLTGYPVYVYDLA